jgi:hypothetical protein
MQDLIQEINENAKSTSIDAESVSVLYDKYAPALYGRIIQVVKQKEIAEKILEKVFINALVDKSIKQPTHLTQFTSLLNHSRKKSYGTLKALRMVEACSCGTQRTIAVAQ